MNYPEHNVENKLVLTLSLSLSLHELRKYIAHLASKMQLACLGSLQAARN